MPPIVFTEQAVAFIDVLGFKGLVEEAVTDPSKLATLQELTDLLESTIPMLDAGVESSVPRELIPKYTYISDCIILSAPLNVSDPGWSHYKGLEIVVMRAIQLTHRFLDAGYLLRGGIAVGKVWHSNGNIIGPAYQEAYQLETSTGSPRIVLSEGAQRLYRRNSRTCIPYQGDFMVNGLHDYYIPSSAPNRIEQTFDRYISIANDKIHNITDPGARSKWEWFKEYLLEERREALQWE